MKNNALGALASLVLAVSILGCGSSSGDGGGGSSGTGGSGSGGRGGGTGSGGSSGTGGATAATPLHVSCMAYCVAEDKCKADTTVADCVSYTCPPAGESNSKDGLVQSCQMAWINYWNCIAAQADVCMQPGTCTTQADAFATACP